MIWEKDRNWNETRRTYDEYSHILREESADGGIKYRHRLDRAGRCMAVINADGESAYAYNNLDILCMATSPLGHTTRYLYNSMADPIGLVRPNRAKETYENDAFHQLMKRTDCMGAVYA
ncbi:MAG: hypothetical protein K2O91_10680, partial [Lachnospiraceae bacterium]|nr:hypothetical protein [Lachnospiraceae bacterium]